MTDKDPSRRRDHLRLVPDPDGQQPLPPVHADLPTAIQDLAGHITFIHDAYTPETYRDFDAFVLLKGLHEVVQFGSTFNGDVDAYLAKTIQATSDSGDSLAVLHEAWSMVEKLLKIPPRAQFASELAAITRSPIVLHREVVDQIEWASDEAEQILLETGAGEPQDVFNEIDHRLAMAMGVSVIGRGHESKVDAEVRLARDAWLRRLSA